MKIKALLLGILCIVISNLQGKNFKASYFGIESNGTTLNTRSIQKAIDFIHENGGGRLVFYVGRYLTGSIYLKSKTWDFGQKKQPSEFMNAIVYRIENRLK